MNNLSKNVTFQNSIKIEKLQRVEVPVEYQKEEGCIAFQLIRITYQFYGKLMTDTLDTKILADGTQLVHNGNGFINDGFIIS